MNNQANVNGIDTLRRFQRSETVRNIIADKPGFLIRWGMACCFLVLTLAVIWASAISYPEAVQVQASITVAAGKLYFADITIPQAGAGKIAAGKQILLRFHAAGADPVRGKVETMVQTDTGYNAKVRLYGQPRYAGGANLKATVIIENTSLLKKLCSGLRDRALR